MFGSHTTQTKQVIGYVLMGISTAKISARIHESFFYSMIITLVIILIGIGVSIVLSHFITKPIETFIAATRDLSKGTFKSRVPKCTYKELDILAESFNDMTQKMEENESFKEQFLVNMSHELRNPLNPIIALSSAMVTFWKDRTEDQKKKAFSIIHERSKNLLALISPILDFIESSNEKDSDNHQEIDLRKLALELTISTNEIIKNKPLVFETRMPDNIPDFYTDKSKLCQIIDNLLSNAIKFTHKGTIQLQITYSKPHFIFEVKDTGIGIQEKDINRIFERFQQVKQVKNQGNEGIGIGLSLCKSLVELLGGNISVQSEYGKGSSFQFSIPNSQDKLVERCKNGRKKDIVHRR